jgi:uncharacterized protein
MGRDRTLITGASTGIGRELAHICARAGQSLVITARDVAALEALAAEITGRHRVEVLPIAHDLSNETGGITLFEKVRSAGVGIDVLINNAGVGLYGAFASTDLAAEKRLMQLNVVSLVELSKRCVHEMLARRRGRIMNVASTAAFVPGPTMAVYYASKAFVLSFSEALAEELRDSGISVTALCPGPTRTEFQTRAGVGSSKLFKGAVMDAPSVAEAGFRAMMRGDRVVVPGPRNKMVPFAARLLPRRVMAVLSRKASEQRMPAPSSSLRV